MTYWWLLVTTGDYDRHDFFLMRRVAGRRSAAARYVLLSVLGLLWVSPSFAADTEVASQLVRKGARMNRKPEESAGLQDKSTVLFKKRITQIFSLTKSDIFSNSSIQ